MRRRKVSRTNPAARAYSIVPNIWPRTGAACIGTASRIGLPIEQCLRRVFRAMARWRSRAPPHQRSAEERDNKASGIDDESGGEWRSGGSDPCALGTSRVMASRERMAMRSTTWKSQAISSGPSGWRYSWPVSSWRGRCPNTLVMARQCGGIGALIENSRTTRQWICGYQITRAVRRCADSRGCHMLRSDWVTLAYATSRPFLMT